jgi:ESCRT-II complex subunit VPS36
VEQHISLSPEEYARIGGVPFLLAKQGLIMSESRGHLCRDESVEGLRFYTNYILHGFPQ